MYDIGRYDLISVFMALPSLMTVIGIFLTKNHMVKFGKKKMASIGYIGAGLSLIAIFLTRRRRPKSVQDLMQKMLQKPLNNDRIDLNIRMEELWLRNTHSELI